MTWTDVEMVASALTPFDIRLYSRIVQTKTSHFSQIQVKHSRTMWTRAVDEWGSIEFSRGGVEEGGMEDMEGGRGLSGQCVQCAAGSPEMMWQCLLPTGFALCTHSPSFPSIHSEASLSCTFNAVSVKVNDLDTWHIKVCFSQR